MSPPRDPVIIDGGDRACVRLLLELRARISGLPAGTVIHLIASDPAAPVDLSAWCHLTGHAYLGPVVPGSWPDGRGASWQVRVVRRRSVSVRARNATEASAITPR
ncbi:MAG TPA: sulfurtransferase TusA family protein [Streptosporangiaceae bacterium]|nr:sulfurtransferase TusA family protein [Streptosporangiaceae bacterium]